MFLLDEHVYVGTMASMVWPLPVAAALLVIWLGLAARGRSLLSGAAYYGAAAIALVGFTAG